MNEAHQFGPMDEYLESLKGQPESAWPLHGLGEQMKVSVEQAGEGEALVLREAVAQYNETSSPMNAMAFPKTSQ